MQLGELILRYRKEHGISMEELAARSGLSKGYISMLEKIKTLLQGSQSSHLPKPFCAWQRPPVFRSTN